jgi:hypothetical protein
MMLTIITLLYFVIAGVGGQILCEVIKSLENRTESNIDKLTSNPYENTDNYVAPSYSSILEACEQDDSAYDAFNLKTAYDVTQIKSLSTQFFCGIVLPPANSDTKSISKAITFFTQDIKKHIYVLVNSPILKKAFTDFEHQVPFVIFYVGDTCKISQPLTDTKKDFILLNKLQLGNFSCRCQQLP